MSRIVTVAVACLAAIACVSTGCVSTGCVSIGSVKDEARSGVRFASAAAAQTFYEAYISAHYTRPASTRPYVAVTVLVPFQHHVDATDNVYFNADAAVADADHDGVITDAEARRYAQRAARPLPAGNVAVANAAVAAAVK